MSLIHTPLDVFYFGAPGGQLFGVFHESQTYAQRGTGIVICNPFGHEYIRSHRALRHLGTRLAEAGFPVLRLDYRGTGDASGEAEEFRLRDWQDDIGTAINELRERSGVESVCVAGLRLGASLALRASDAVDAVILWEPIISGRSYLAELEQQHTELLWRFFDDFEAVTAGVATEYLGFPMPPELRTDLEELDLLSHRSTGVVQALVVESQVNSGSERICERLRSEGCNSDYRLIPSFTIWREDVDKGLVPDQVLAGIVAWAAEVLP